MTRPARILVELLAPPLLGASPFLFMAIVTGTLGIIPFLLLVAYAYALVPSLIFTAVLEVSYGRGLDPRSAKASGLASALGLAAGIAMGAWPSHPNRRDPIVFLGLFGALAGLATARLARGRTPRSVSAAPPG